MDLSICLLNCNFDIDIQSLCLGQLHSEIKGVVRPKYIILMFVIVAADNAIPIKSWFNDANDTALLNLLPVLDALRFTHDVRSVLSRNLHLHRLW